MTPACGSVPRPLCRPQSETQTSEPRCPEGIRGSPAHVCALKYQAWPSMCARAATSSGKAAGMPVNAKSDRIWIPFVTRATAGNSIRLQDHSRRRKEHKVTSLDYHARSMGNEEQCCSRKDDRIHVRAKEAPHSQLDSMHQYRGRRQTITRRTASG
jgi:hypothetical protein